MNILEVKDLSKKYYSYSNGLSRIFYAIFPKLKTRKYISVLDKISFSVKKGECVGIIGINGAGKSTLLKIVSKTLGFSDGDIKIYGKVASILELGMGFNSELSGRMNVYQSCALLGYTKKETDNFMDNIMEFAQIGEYFDQPIRTYSSGMQMRLAFAIVTAKRPDILIIDEALSVGDIYFQHKSFDKIREFKALGTTLIIVSHDIAVIKSICDRVILLNNGKIEKDGDPEEVFDLYNALIAKKESNDKITQLKNRGEKVVTISGNGKVFFNDIFIEDIDGNLLTIVDVASEFYIRLRFTVNDQLESLVIGYQIKDRLSQIINGTNSFYLDDELLSVSPGIYEFKFKLTANFGNGSYGISIAAHSGSNHIGENYLWVDNAASFNVVKPSSIPIFYGSAYADTILIK
ncbi:ABC transporter ATP-binding protein [Campylobacter sp. 19-13652]|uniref:ABC transporter ATP-binding protein n=1 Tax=Campylobacter sp. 19-13652 TaxID=2840180 RepID=UPI001C785477|nr:ABC transporter ATP-binding protein [Campylobacter sp. 19-13652]BCX79794.1 sugar ABC transporter ATP-binding protein [Campylobacter sp. 19-13652]